jgi:hypothetical protein
MNEGTEETSTELVEAADSGAEIQSLEGTSLEPTTPKAIARARRVELKLRARRRRQLAVIDGFRKTGRIVATLNKVKVDTRVHYRWLDDDP